MNGRILGSNGWDGRLAWRWAGGPPSLPVLLHTSGSKSSRRWGGEFAQYWVRVTVRALAGQVLNQQGS